MEKANNQQANGIETKQGCLRYMLAAMLFCGVALNYIIKVMLSVAIVAMVKPHGHSDGSNNTNISTEDTCPGGEEESEETGQGGTFEWDGEMQGHILASYFYGYVATQLLGGWTADKLGGRWVYALGVMVTGILALFCPLAANLHPTAFMALRALQGAFSGVILPATNVLMSKWFAIEERPKISGLVFGGNYAGTLISMGLSGVLVDVMDWTSVFYVYGGACILYVLPWLYLSSDTPEVHPRIGEKERDYIINGRREDIAKMEDQSQEQSGLISAFPYVFAWISGGVFGTVSSWLQARGYFSRMTAYIVFNGIAAIGPAIFLLLITLLGCDSTAIVVCFVAIATLKTGIYGGSMLNNLDLAPNFVGSTTGILYTLVNLTGVVSPIVNGAITTGQQTLTKWHTVFYISIGTCVVPFIFFWIFGSVEEQTWNQPKGKEEVRKDSCKTSLKERRSVSYGSRSSPVSSLQDLHT
ncbi:sialin isoform X3 [Anabrus simplex]|uniref:sialin isoform X3 n=1 Tax=Anabrus simplex TaxID=316456 RepID=UPI0035A35990